MRRAADLTDLGARVRNELKQLGSECDTIITVYNTTGKKTANWQFVEVCSKICTCMLAFPSTFVKSFVAKSWCLFGWSSALCMWVFTARCDRGGSAPYLDAKILCLGTRLDNCDLTTL